MCIYSAYVYMCVASGKYYKLSKIEAGKNKELLVKILKSIGLKDICWSSLDKSNFKVW